MHRSDTHTHTGSAPCLIPTALGNPVCQSVGMHPGLLEKNKKKNVWIHDFCDGKLWDHFKDYVTLNNEVFDGGGEKPKKKVETLIES